jgi:hypothetical protein
MKNYISTLSDIKEQLRISPSHLTQGKRNVFTLDHDSLLSDNLFDNNIRNDFNYLLKSIKRRTNRRCKILNLYY